MSNAKQHKEQEQLILVQGEAEAGVVDGLAIDSTGMQKPTESGVLRSSHGLQRRYPMPNASKDSIPLPAAH